MLPDRVLSAMETGSMVTMANGRSASERRAIAEFLTGKTFATALSTTPAPRAMCTPRNAPFTPGDGPSLERLGAEHVEHPLPERGRPDRGRRAEAEGQVGVRVPGRPAVVLADHDRRRPHLRRQLGRQGVLTQRLHRVHPLVLRRRRGRAVGRSASARSRLRAAVAGPRSSGTRPATPMRWTPRPARRSGRRTWTTSRWRA